jgi:hypothetical protein
MVHDKPFIMLAGEVHNSNSSSVEYMEGVWDKAQALGMNTLLLPISWEMTEPQEGVFDFSLTDGLIEQARTRGGKLVFLWFGAWKNAQCYYAPEWVKTDLHRFRRAEVEKGQNLVHLKDFYGMPYTTLSYLCEATKDADTKAFRALMEHIKTVDEQKNTVLMVQVENETGLKGTGREHSDKADALFDGPVPQDFADYMRTHTDTMVADVRKYVESGAASGSWEQVFGAAVEEIFSAFYTANYVNTVAAAGKAVYPLPLTVNCWLDKDEQAGRYPSGGPVSRMFEVWSYCAPNIDLFCPDIYVPDFCGVCDEYTRRGNALFIPETATHSYAGPRAVYVVGRYHALGYAPFGFENMGEDFTATEGFLFGMDVSDPALKTAQNGEEYAWYNNTLRDMTSLLTEKYGTNDLQAAICERKEDDTMLFGDFGIKVLFDHPMLIKKDGVCLGLQVRANELYLIVNRCGLMAFSTNPAKPHVDILALEEGRFENGQWRMIRRLNGDEAMVMCYHKPALLRLKLFAYT